MTFEEWWRKYDLKIAKEIGAVRDSRIMVTIEAVAERAWKDSKKLLISKR